MEGSKKQKGSSSTFTSELFGSKDSPPPPSSSGYFASIFPPPSAKKERRNSSSSGQVSWEKCHSNNQAWQVKRTTTDNVERRNEDARNSTYNKNQSSTYQEHQVEPCHLSSSLYYGGQDIYPSSGGPQNSDSYSIYQRSGADDDDHNNDTDSACRGNWWQGSLYY